VAANQPDPLPPLLPPEVSANSHHPWPGFWPPRAEQGEAEAECAPYVTIPVVRFVVLRLCLVLSQSVGHAGLQQPPCLEHTDVTQE